MTRLYLLVEGQTEEAFVKELLAPHYAEQQLFITPIIARTGPESKGGIVSYSKIKPQVTRLCRQHRSAYVSTLIDLYALPEDFPGKRASDYPSNGSGKEKANFLEGKFLASINEPNFIPNFLVHEYEALLFVQPDKFSEWTDDAEIVAHLSKIADHFACPEDINDKPETAPSKRIKAIMKNYRKTIHGPLIACAIGMEDMRKNCPHFHEWLLKLEKLIT